MKDIRPTTQVKVHGLEFVTTSVEISGMVRNPPSFPAGVLASMRQIRSEVRRL